ncbi:hypothetical protein BDW62DRAFT_179585 [Aspergillus aurantiobrunneus]
MVLSHGHSTPVCAQESGCCMQLLSPQETPVRRSPAGMLAVPGSEQTLLLPNPFHTERRCVSHLPIACFSWSRS